jgi:hypothetical protein
VKSSGLLGKGDRPVRSCTFCGLLKICGRFLQPLDVPQANRDRGRGRLMPGARVACSNYPTG